MRCTERDAGSLCELLVCRQQEASIIDRVQQLLAAVKSNQVGPWDRKATGT